MTLPKSKVPLFDFCLCGCGTKVGRYSKLGYAKGHHLRSEAGKRRISEINTGKPISAEHRKKLSDQFKGRTFAPDTIKKLSEGKRGALNPNWRGGVSLEPYAKDWWTVRIHIRKRDGAKCLIDSKHPVKPWRHADIHHIDSDQTNCDDRNLISLCRSCHSKIERNWQAHIDELHAILTKRYGYIYG